MENELTKRKWKAKEYEARFDEGVLIIDENNMLVAIVIDECVPYSEEKAIANAKLIAAAPELLEALNKFVLASEKTLQLNEGSLGGLINNAIEVIKKATE